MLLACVVLIPIPARGDAARSSAMLGLPPLPQTTSAEVRSQRERLGQKLFFDTRLSADGKISCASCHRADLGFSDGRARSRGHEQKEGTRNAPSLLNVAYARSLFWDGRAADLSHQARAPLTNPVEHALSDDDALLKIVRADAGYVEAFRSAYGIRQDAITSATVTDAIAVYERSLLSGGSPFDRYQYGGERSALSPAAARGLELFRGRDSSASRAMKSVVSLRCSRTRSFISRRRACRRQLPENLSVLARKVFDAKSASPELERLIATEPEIAALGRFIVTRDPRDIGKVQNPFPAQRRAHRAVHARRQCCDARQGGGAGTLWAR